jgi:DNA repair exonuclease SbcCD ATPase subunit
MKQANSFLEKATLATIADSPLGAAIFREQMNLIESQRRALHKECTAMREKRLAHEAEAIPIIRGLAGELKEARERLRAAETAFDRYEPEASGKIRYMREQESELRAQIDRMTFPVVEDMKATVQSEINSRQSRLGFSEGFRLRTVDGIAPRREEYEAIVSQIAPLEELRRELVGLNWFSTVDVIDAARRIWSARPDVFGTLPAWLAAVETQSAEPVAAAAPAAAESAPSTAALKRKGFIARLTTGEL